MSKSSQISVELPFHFRKQDYCSIALDSLGRWKITIKDANVAKSFNAAKLELKEGGELVLKYKKSE